MLAGETLEQMIARHEGTRPRPYLDSKGLWTVGIGHLMTRPLSAKAIDQIFQDDFCDAVNECTHAFPWFSELTTERQAVLVDLCFNMGLTRLLGFEKMLTALALGDYATARAQLLDSDAARDLPTRYQELADMMDGSAKV